VDTILQKYQNVSLEECLDRLKTRNYPYYHSIILLLFKYQYEHSYDVYVNRKYTIHVNQNSGKFYLKNKINKLNESDYFLYLGTRKTNTKEYFVMIDFVSQCLECLPTFELSEYIQLPIPLKTFNLTVPPISPEHKIKLFQDVVSGTLSDFVLPCKDGNLNVSKFILSMNSPYFRNYFLYNETLSIDFYKSDVEKYLYYCIVNKLETETPIHPEWITMGKYFMDDSFVKYIYTESVLQIDKDQDIEPKDKIDLYHNLLTYI
jgi:hypothetical protein